MNHLETADDVVEVVQTRTFDAPLSLVWRVWTEVEYACFFLSRRLNDALWYRIYLQ
jgi:hypothetical protein